MANAALDDASPERPFVTDLRPSFFARATTAWWVAGLSALVFAITEIPYRYAERYAPEGARFVGQIAMSDDINSYYSFIRQASSGHWLFRNNMTHVEHGRVFANLEWLALGKFMAMTNCSPRTLFLAWRVFGIVAVLGAFAWLASIVLPTPLQRRVGLLMFAFGGGFAWALVALSKFGLVDVSAKLGLQNPAIDLITPLHPFGQMMKNPHFSLPHGTFLASIALYLLAERDGRPRWYWAAGIASVTHGLMRPYDLISLFAVLPSFILVEAIRARAIDWRRTVLRAAPLICSAPLLAYYVFIFSLHPVFKFWASQGGQPPAPIWWHALAYGLAGVLCAYRICRFRTAPLTQPIERFIALWIAIVFALFHSYKFVPILPYSPQVAVPLATPMILLAASVFRLPEAVPAGNQRRKLLAAVAAFLVVNSLTTPLYVVRAATDAASRPQSYALNEDFDAAAWLADQAAESNIILARFAPSGFLSQYVTARFVVGHWALTPNANAWRDRADQLIAGEMPPAAARDFLAEVRADYVYFTGDMTREKRARWDGAIVGLPPVYENGRVTIYKTTRSP